MTFRPTTVCLAALLCFSGALFTGTAVPGAERQSRGSLPPCDDSPFDVSADGTPGQLDPYDMLELLQADPADAGNPFDINDDDVYSTADLLIFLSLFGTDACEADVNMNGVVDTFDLDFAIQVLF